MVQMQDIPFRINVMRSYVGTMLPTFQNSNSYISCIKIAGIPILPPLITDEQRIDLMELKKQAVMVENRLREQQRIREQPTLSRKDSGIFTDTTSSPKEVSARSVSEQDLESSCSVLCAEKENVQPPKLVRQNSYTLDSPSPQLIAFMEKQRENERKPGSLKRTHTWAVSGINRTTSTDFKPFKRSPDSRRSRKNWDLEQAKTLWKDDKKMKIIIHKSPKSSKFEKSSFSYSCPTSPLEIKREHSFTLTNTKTTKMLKTPKNRTSTPGRFERVKTLNCEPYRFPSKPSDTSTKTLNLDNINTIDCIIDITPSTPNNTSVITPQKVNSINDIDTKTTSDSSTKSLCNLDSICIIDITPATPIDTSVRTLQKLDSIDRIDVRSVTSSDSSIKTLQNVDSNDADVSPLTPERDNMFGNNDQFYGPSRDVYTVCDQNLAISNSCDDTMSVCSSVSLNKYMQSEGVRKAHSLYADLKVQHQQQFEELLRRHELEKQVLFSRLSNIFINPDQSFSSQSSYHTNLTLPSSRLSETLDEQLSDRTEQVKSSRRHLFPPLKCPVDYTQKEKAAAAIINAYARGYLVRRLFKTRRVEQIVLSIKDSISCAFKLHTEENLTPADIELHGRLIVQMTAGLFALDDIFNLPVAQKMALIKADRELRKTEKSRPNSIRSLSSVSQKSIARKQNSSADKIKDIRVNNRKNTHRRSPSNVSTNSEKSTRSNSKQSLQPWR